jgi:hypothetical protein
MYDLALALTDHRDDRFDTLMPTSPTPRAIRRMNESRRASQRARKHIVLAALARNRARDQSESEADAPNVSGLLAAWDAHVADARAHFAAQDEAYRLARVVPEHDGIESSSPVWLAMLNNLHDLNSTEA